MEILVLLSRSRLMLPYVSGNSVYWFPGNIRGIFETYPSVRLKLLGQQVMDAGVRQVFLRWIVVQLLHVKVPRRVLEVGEARAVEDTALELKIHSQLRQTTPLCASWHDIRTCRPRIRCSFGTKRSSIRFPTFVRPWKDCGA